MKPISLTRQLFILFTILLSITALLTSLPAFLIIHNVLDEQLEERQISGEEHVQTIWQLNNLQIQETVRLAAQRPTLNQLVNNKQSEEISTYLSIFRANTRLDYLYVVDVSGNLIGGTFPSDEDDIEKLLVQEPITDEIFVVGGINLDDAFWGQLEQQTGFAYQAAHTLTDTSRFRSRIVSLNEGFSIQMLLAVEDIRYAEQSAFISILVIASMTTMLGAITGGLYLRQRIHPLWRLKDQAKRLGEGDLLTPIAIDTHSPDVQTLAQTLEISRQKLSQTLKEVQQERDWSNALVQAIVEGIISYDIQGKIVFHSESACQILHWTESHLGEAIDEVLIPHHPSGVFLDIVPQEGSRKTIDIITEQNHVISLSITRARTLADGETTLVLRDITETQRRRSAQAYYLANMSHEFRTPLSGMKASLELLSENLGRLTQEEQKQLLSSILISTTTLQHLIDNLLEGSKLEANQFTLRQQNLSFDILLMEVLSIMQPILARRQQKLSLQIPLQSLHITADKTRLIQVLINLLSNASKYSPQDSGIELKIEIQEQQVLIEIADEGDGIPETEANRVFQHFVRLESNIEPDHSTGLGLAVVHGIISAHQGQVGVRPRTDKGSIFWFTLPIQEQSL